VNAAGEYAQHLLLSLELPELAATGEMMAQVLYAPVGMNIRRNCVQRLARSGVSIDRILHSKPAASRMRRLPVCASVGDILKLILGMKLDFPIEDL
jgi:hypothetical protein